MAKLISLKIKFIYVQCLHLLDELSQQVFIVLQLWLLLRLLFLRKPWLQQFNPFILEKLQSVTAANNRQQLVKCRQRVLSHLLELAIDNIVRNKSLIYIQFSNFPSHLFIAVLLNSKHTLITLSLSWLITQQMQQVF